MRSPKRRFYRPPDDSREMQYLRERRESLGGYVPGRPMVPLPMKVPKVTDYKEFLAGSGKREVSDHHGFRSPVGKALAR